MRKVDHLLGAELIHDLYNQHHFQINSIRFRNTAVYWKDGTVHSFAPQEEWAQLEKYLSERFFELEPLLLEQLTALYDLKRDFVETYLSGIDVQKLAAFSDAELQHALLNTHFFSLGDLYRLNFVQVEYGLTKAVQKEIQRLGHGEDMLAKLIVSGVPTEFQKEEMEFAVLMRGAKDLSTKVLEERVRQHHERYAFMHSAYGEQPYTLEYYLQKAQDLRFETLTTEDIAIAAGDAKRLLVELGSARLSALVPLMIRGGEFRDSNKARLGQTMRYKFALLDEVSRRSGISREDVNFYLLSELLELVSTKSAVAGDVVSRRKKEGVLLLRSESELSADAVRKESFADFLKATGITGEMSSEGVLKGVCASPGRVSACAKVVLSHADASKIERGDIMVAIGTDFDLMDAIQRAAAVITEEGGLLSHASVVCRELKKPCCIGVAGATSAIADGDYVELDASKGVVRIQTKERELQKDLAAAAS